LTDFQKILLASNLIKIHPVGSQLFPVDGQTDMTKLLVTFCSFADVPKRGQ